MLISGFKRLRSAGRMSYTCARVVETHSLDGYLWKRPPYSASVERSPKLSPGRWTAAEAGILRVVSQLSGRCDGIQVFIVHWPPPQAHGVHPGGDLWRRNWGPGYYGRQRAHPAMHCARPGLSCGRQMRYAFGQGSGCSWRGTRQMPWGSSRPALAMHRRWSSFHLGGVWRGLRVDGPGISLPGLPGGAGRSPRDRPRRAQG